LPFLFKVAVKIWAPESRFHLTRTAQEAQDWRLMIFSPSVETLGPRQVYGMLRGILTNPSGEPIPIPSERIYVLGSHDIRYREMRSAALGAGTGVPITGGRNLAGEDAYIYRVA